MNKLLISFFFLFPIWVLSQEVSNITFQKVGKKVEVIYDLSTSGSGFIELFYSINDGESFKGPLKVVTGDVGENQKSGKSKKIIWEPLAEDIELVGNVKFKVENTKKKSRLAAI